VARALAHLMRHVAPDGARVGTRDKRRGHIDDTRDRRPTLRYLPLADPAASGPANSACATIRRRAPSCVAFLSQRFFRSFQRNIGVQRIEIDQGDRENARQIEHRLSRLEADATAHLGRLDRTGKPGETGEIALGLERHLLERPALNEYVCKGVGVASPLCRQPLTRPRGAYSQAVAVSVHRAADARPSCASAPMSSLLTLALPHHLQPWPDGCQST
jgi:hypothetical protein